MNGSYFISEAYFRIIVALEADLLLKIGDKYRLLTTIKCTTTCWTINRKSGFIEIKASSNNLKVT